MRSGWIPDFGDLTYNLAVQYGWVYGLSLTEMEIVHGAFRKCNPNGTDCNRIFPLYLTGILEFCGKKIKIMQNFCKDLREKMGNYAE